MTTNTVSDVTYDYQSQFLDIATKYFTVANTSTLKVGMFGYVNEILSYIAKDGVFHRNFLYSEYFLNIASMSSSVYNWAKILDEPISFAVPSRLQSTLSFDIDELRSAINTNSNTVNISRKTQFTVGNFKYLLPYSINIIFLDDGNSSSITAIYDMSTSGTNYKDPLIKSPYLKTLIVDNKLIIAIDLYQLELKETKFKVLSDDLIDRSIYDISFTDSLSSFNVVYNINKNNSTNEFLPVIFNDLEDSPDIKYAFYTPLSDTSLRIYFNTKAGFFKPEFNSSLTVESFITKGSTGNFRYLGSINMDTTNLKNIKYECLAISNSIGGQDINSLIELKKKLINKLKSRNSLNTTYDLNQMFVSLQKENPSNSSFLLAIKTRDDFIKRSYSIFTLLKDSNNETVPTNTVDIELTISDLENMNYTIKPGTLIIFDRTTNKYRFLDNDEIPDYYLANKESYLFCNPFLVNLDFKEFPKVNFYHTNYLKNFTMYYDFVNTNSPYEVLINNLLIERNSLIDLNEFKIRCYLNSNVITALNLKLRVILYKNGSPVGYGDMNRIDTTTEFNLIVNTEDTFDDQGRYLIKNTFYDFDGNLIPDIALSGDIQIKLGVLYDAPNVNTNDNQYPFNQINGSETQRLAAILSPKTNIEIAESLTDVLYSPLSINNTTGIVTIKKLPLIGAVSYLNNTRSQDISNSIFNYITYLRSISNSLANNTDLNLKFFNSCGLSNNFSSDTTDLSIKMQMRLSVTPNNTIESKIKKAIVSFIENINLLDVKRFSLSNLITYLENNFTEIKFIKFVSINGANIQNIEEQNIYLENNYPKNFVPEYLCVRKVNGNDLDNKGFIYNIDLQYI